ncbi:MAG TPA: cysteine--tRNA ligase [Acidimicrobiales bacterium]|jgi:cysteinyl-tRNA synthetase|nr:cysteine--tRNA ligase [Acidimicrobiales bacterium]
MLHLHDTATGTVRPLEHRTEGHVSMYVCGLTVYDLPHIGHGRMTLVFDILRRYLLFDGLAVHYVSNITDVDDNIIKRANEQGRTESEVAAEFEARWWEAVNSLGVLQPNDIPHATAYVSDMVALVADLVARGVAYETSDGIYLNVEQVPGYGLLARQSLDSLRAGARVEANEEKRSPLDFVLWKKAKKGEPSWESPWGPGRPGWHTECVVMSLDLLGDGFDLHGGGRDLAFPHHENERAQAVAEGRPFARHWMHNGWVEVEGTKMSKSLGNFTTLPDLLERHDGRAYRILVLRAHYRAPIEVTPETIADAEKALARLDGFARRFGAGGLLEEAADGYVVAGIAPATGLDEGSLAAFRARMDDDLDTPGALAGIFELVTAANSKADTGSDAEAAALARTAAVLLAALGVSLRDESGEVDEAAADLVAARDEARRSKDFARADALRDELVALGWTVEDTPSGTAIRR